MGAGAAPPSLPDFPCLPTPRPQSLAVNLTLEEYRATLQAASACASPQQASGGGGAAPTAASLPSLSHLSLSSAELEAMGLCSHCRYPCYLRWVLGQEWAAGVGA